MHFPYSPFPFFPPPPYGHNFSLNPYCINPQIIPEIVRTEAPLINNKNVDTVNLTVDAPKVSDDDVMNDLERLKDVELIDLLDDTTKSILDSLKSLQLQYGIELDGESDECTRKAAELLNAEHKASLCSSLTNLLRRDFSNASVLSMTSLNDRHNEENRDITEEKVNLLRSLTNLLKAESAIGAAVQSQSRSRLNSFTASEKSLKLKDQIDNDSDFVKNNDKTYETTSSTFTKEEKELNEDQKTTQKSNQDENSKKQNEFLESEQDEQENEVDFWASLQREDDYIPPRKTVWESSESYFSAQESLSSVINNPEEVNVNDKHTKINENTESENRNYQNTNSFDEIQDKDEENQISEEEHYTSVNSKMCDKNVNENSKKIYVDINDKNDEDNVVQVANTNTLIPYKNKIQKQENLAEDSLNLTRSECDVKKHEDSEPKGLDNSNYKSNEEFKKEKESAFKKESLGQQESPSSKEELSAIMVDNIAPPEGFQDNGHGNLKPQEYMWTPEQYAYLMHAIWNQNYFANQSSMPFISHPAAYYPQFNAYQEYLQQYNQQCFQQQPQNMESHQNDEYMYGDHEQSDNSISEWYDASQQESYYEDPNCEIQQQEHTNEPIYNQSNKISESSVNEMPKIEEEAESPKDDDENEFIDKISNNWQNDCEESYKEKICDEDDNQLLGLQGNIDLIVEDHTELLEEEIVEGKMLIIPSEIANFSQSGDTSQDEEKSTSCTVITSTVIERRFGENTSNSDSDQIVVYEIEDEMSSELPHELENPDQESECESMCEEEPENEVQHSDRTEEQSEEEVISDSEIGQDIGPLVYFKNNVTEHLPHQLSIIFEVTEHSERGSVRSSSVESNDSNGDTTMNNESNEEDIQKSRPETENECESVLENVSVSLPMRKSLSKEKSPLSDVNVVVNLTPKSGSLEPDSSGSRKNSMIEENDSDVSVNVMLPLKRNKFSNVALNVVDVSEKHDINDSFDMYDSLDIDEDKEKHDKNEVRVEAHYTTDENDSSDESSNEGDNEYETSAQSSGTMINDSSLNALSNLNFVKLESLANRASSVPPSTSKEMSDEAIQRRFQTLREQWGQLAKEFAENDNQRNPKVDTSSNEKWKIMFLDANQDWMTKNSQKEQQIFIRPQSCLTIPIEDKESKEPWCSNKMIQSDIQAEENQHKNLNDNESWWPKRKISSKISGKDTRNVESKNVEEIQFAVKTRLQETSSITKVNSSPIQNPEKENNESNWWPKRRAQNNYQKEPSPKKPSPTRNTKSDKLKPPLKYRLVHVQALETESESSDSEVDETESEGNSKSQNDSTISQSTSGSWKNISSKSLKQRADVLRTSVSKQCISNSDSNSNNYFSDAPSSDYERANSCPKQMISKDPNQINSRFSRPNSCTREIETRSENIRFIRASSVTRESSLSRQSSNISASDTESQRALKMNEKTRNNLWNQSQRQSESSTTWEEYVPHQANPSPTVDWTNEDVVKAQTLEWPCKNNIAKPTRNTRSMSVTKEIESPKYVNNKLFLDNYRPASCTKEMETLKSEKTKTSSFYRQVNMETDVFKTSRQSPCSFSTHPERPASCTLELELGNNPLQLHVESAKKQIEELNIEADEKNETLQDLPVVRRRVKRQPRPVSCAGDLEKQSYRNSLEGSRIEALSDFQAMPTVIEIHHTRPARPQSCTRELENYWSGRSRCRSDNSRARAHSVTREITLCPSPGPSVSSTNSDIEDKRRISVRDRVDAIEELALINPMTNRFSVERSCRPEPSVKSSIDESEADDDSGVQSSKYVSEVETDTEGFSEMRKMTPYQRVNTQTKLFQYLQECVTEEQEEQYSESSIGPKREQSPFVDNEFLPGPKPCNLISEISAIHKQSIDKAKETETPQQRRQRLSLPLVHQHSSGIESVDSSIASPSSPVREKLANELVQSLLIKNDGRQFRNIPLEKLHAAALRILQEETSSVGACGSSTVDSTPALTPSEFQDNSPCSYEAYHASWQQNTEQPQIEDNYDYSMFPSKTFKRLHEQVCGGPRRGSLTKSPLTKTYQDTANLPSNQNQYYDSHSPSPFGN